MSNNALLQVAVGVLKNTAGKILISLRKSGVHQGGLWEFPGGKLDVNESAEQALVREFKEELDITINSASPLIAIKHKYADLAVQLHVFLVTEYSGEAKGCEGQFFKWVTPTELNKHTFPAANQPIIKAAQLPDRYAILDDAEDEAILLARLQYLLDRKIKLIQLRLKNTPVVVVRSFLEKAYPLCQAQGVVLLLNSAVKQMEDFSLDGLHLTSTDLMAIGSRPVSEYDIAENEYWVSASCHNLKELKHAQRIGIDFVVLAPVLPTQTHPDTQSMGWVQFAELVSQVNIPVYALGGLSETDLDQAQVSGAQGIAAIRAFLKQ